MVDSSLWFMIHLNQDYGKTKRIDFLIRQTIKHNNGSFIKDFLTQNRIRKELLIK